MAHKLSAAAQQRLIMLEEIKRKWSRVHRLVEESAVQRSGQDVFWQQIRRATKEIQRTLTDIGWNELAENVKEMEIAVRRPTPARTKTRRMREVVAGVREGLEAFEKGIRETDRSRVAAQARAKRARTKHLRDEA
jgi:hypothetical protein